MKHWESEIAKKLEELETQGVIQLKNTHLFHKKSDMLGIWKNPEYLHNARSYANSMAEKLIEEEKYQNIQWIINLANAKQIPFYQAVHLSVLENSQCVDKWLEIIGSVEKHGCVFFSQNGFNVCESFHTYMEKLVKHIIQSLDNQSDDEKTNFIRFLQFMHNKNKGAREMVSWMILFKIFGFKAITNNFSGFSNLITWMCHEFEHPENIQKKLQGSDFAEKMVEVVDFAERIMGSDFHHNWNTYVYAPKIYLDRLSNIFNGRITLAEIENEHQKIMQTLGVSCSFAEKFIQIYYNWDWQANLPMFKNIVNVIGEEELLKLMFLNQRFFTDKQLLDQFSQSPKEIKKIIANVLEQEKQKQNQARENFDWASLF